MNIEHVLQLIYDSATGTAIRESTFLFPYIECLHVLAITLVFGSILVIDLRLLGFTSRNRRISELMNEFLPYTWGSFLFALISGGLLFTSHAVEFGHNPYFLLKMGLLVAAGLNMALFHRLTVPGISLWDELPRLPISAKCAGAVSLLLWVGVIFSGRWIGFYLDQVRFG